jgi:hypothetical protein
MRNIMRALVLFQLFLVTKNGVAQKFNAGFTLGLDASTINGANLNNHFHKVGLIAGAVVNTSLTPNSIFQFELNFIQKGSLQPPDSLGNGYKKIAMAYIEIPIMIRRRLNFTVRKKPVNRFEIEGGASIGKLMTVTSVNSQNATTPTDHLFNPIDVSLLAGLNFNISKNVYFNFRYSNSVIPSIKRNTPYVYFLRYTWNRGNNQVLQFSFKFILNGVGQKRIAPDDVPAAN